MLHPASAPFLAAGLCMLRSVGNAPMAKATTTPTLGTGNVHDVWRILRRVIPAPTVSYQVRLRRVPGHDLSLHHAALAYLSDFWINTAAINHHVAIVTRAIVFS